MGSLLDAIYSLTLLPHDFYHRRTGKYGPDVGEKRGVLPESLIPGSGRTVWIHAVSVGETLAARPLVAALREWDASLTIRISTTTATGREVAQKHFGAENVFYFPLDLSWMVKRAFDRIGPDLIVLMELEVWPHFLEEAERRRIPVAVSNVRITERSVRNFQRFGNLATEMLRKVGLWLSQNEEYASILRDLGVAEDSIRVVGSLKYEGLDFSEDEARSAALREELGGERRIVAGSTHRGEDEVVYAAFQELRQDFPGLRLVLVPRHPERSDAVEAMAPCGMSVWRRSAGPAPEHADIILGDVMGELSQLYRAADAVFIGGTLLESVGGHNMLEPVAFGRPTVFGPHVHNFSEPAAVLLEADGAVQLETCSADALSVALRTFLDSPEAARDMGLRGREAAQATQGAAAKTLESLKALLA